MNKQGFLQTTNLTVKQFLEPFGNDYCIDICVLDNETGEHYLPALCLDEILGNEDSDLVYAKEVGKLKVQEYQTRGRELLVVVDLNRNLKQATKFYEC